MYQKWGGGGMEIFLIHVSQIPANRCQLISFVSNDLHNYQMLPKTFQAVWTICDIVCILKVCKLHYKC